MPEYSWICPCKESNSAGSQLCRACGLPAEAASKEIQETVTAKESSTFLSRKEYVKARRDEMAILPLWKKPFAYFLRALQFLGVIFFWLGIWNLSFQSIVIGLVVMVFAEVIFQFVKGRPYFWQDAPSEVKR